jgi:type I restriction enzyme S subunit
MMNIVPKSYEDYQHSGIKWLGSAPKNWKILRMKNIFKSFGSGSTPHSSERKYYDEGDVNWLNTTDLKNSVVYETKNKITKLALAELALKVYPRNTLALAMYGQGDTRGSVGLLNVESTTNQAACMMYDTRNAIPKFMLWWFVAQKSNIRKINVGSAQPNMNQDFVRNLFVALPSMKEQQTIADYLDARTAQIDRKIDLLEQKAEKYASLKKSLINETVKRGLNKSTPMKDSGVEWIGQIPAHWEVKRISDIAIQQKHKNVGLLEKNLLSLSYGKLKRKDIETSFGLLPESFETYQIVNPGNVILRLTDLQNDWTSLRVGLARERGIITSAYLCLRFSKHIHPVFSYYVLHVYDLSKVFYWLGSGLRSSMKFEDIKVLPFILPPLEEQKAIAEYLEIKTAHIEKIIETIKLEVEKLKELRKTLVNDVVTGKIKVYEA